MNFKLPVLFVMSVLLLILSKMIEPHEPNSLMLSFGIISIVLLSASLPVWLSCKAHHQMPWILPLTVLLWSWLLLSTYQGYLSIVFALVVILAMSQKHLTPKYTIILTSTSLLPLIAAILLTAYRHPSRLYYLFTDVPMSTIDSAYLLIGLIVSAVLYWRSIKQPALAWRYASAALLLIGVIHSLTVISVMPGFAGADDPLKLSVLAVVSFIALVWFTLQKRTDAARAP